MDSNYFIKYDLWNVSFTHEFKENAKTIRDGGIRLTDMVSKYKNMQI